MPRLVALALLMFGLVGAAAAAPAITTYHNDRYRTGWNSAETLLTPALVKGGTFGLVAQVPIDEQVDAQPLFLPAVSIAGGMHDVVYVASENNTIYALDSATGAVLLSQNYGTAVPYTLLPAQCINNSAVVGINSTPVIDQAAGLLYFVAYTVESGTLTFRLHAVSVSTLADALPPVVVSGQAGMSDGTSFAFNANYQRQRPALLLANGNVYAGFGSFCDGAPQISRGWLLGWNAASLVALPANNLLNKRATSKYNFFLTSIWMSGYGLSADAQGNVYLATANSDYSGSSYNKVLNPAQSVLKFAPDLSAVQGLFTPGNHAVLDQQDNDLGAGGVMTLPPQGLGTPNLAVANGKANGMYLLDTDAFSTTSQLGVVLGTTATPPCWCGPSYYVGSDAIGRVVNSAGTAITIYKVGSGAAPRLTRAGMTAPLSSGPDPGFFTSVSSNGEVPGSAAVWAVLRAAAGDTTNTLTLAAFDPAAKMAQLFTSPAGTWPYAFEANSNTVPTVAAGRVYVASYKQLSIFGIAPPPAAKRTSPAPAIAPDGGFAHAVFGIVQSAASSRLVIMPRNGHALSIDTSHVRNGVNPAASAIGSAVLVRGQGYDASGALGALSVLRVKNVPMRWPVDR